MGYCLDVELGSLVRIVATVCCLGSILETRTDRVPFERYIGEQSRLS